MKRGSFLMMWLGNGHGTFIRKNIRIARQTCTDRSSFARWILKRGITGGSGKTVKIDDSKFEKRNNIGGPESKNNASSVALKLDPNGLSYSPSGKA